MNGTQPPPVPTGQAKKSGMPSWMFGLIVVGVVVGIAVIGMLAAPSFFRASGTGQINACIKNLRMIDAAKKQWVLENNKTNTDTPTQSDLSQYFIERKMPVCPAGGVYTIKTVPTCSIPRHQLSWQ